ncbi:hypothetical protein [Rhizobium sp. RCAM05973]|uniref:hypothetical protein n=1 Tax=Rhizobium sp. RCAM05973 TaxID=2994066 RepID=UPI0022EBA4B5|nr:hypothetical protein [Rhizobium sp. RCAM05973]
MAEKGNIGAFKEFGRLLERNDRMEAEREFGASSKSEKQPPAERLGKKVIDEQRALDADAELMAELEQEAIQHARH